MTYANINEVPANGTLQANAKELKDFRAILASYHVGVCTIAQTARELASEKSALQSLLNTKRDGYSRIMNGDLKAIGDKTAEIEQYRKDIKEYSVKLASLNAQLNDTKEAQADEMKKGLDWVAQNKLYDAYKTDTDTYYLALCNAIEGFTLRDARNCAVGRRKATDRQVVKTGGDMTTVMTKATFADLQLRTLIDYKPIKACLPTYKFSEAALASLKKKTK